MSFSRKNLCLIALVLAALPGQADVTGTIKLKGEPPPLPRITPRFDTEVCGSEPRPLRELTLGTNQTVAGAIVYLSSPCPTGTTGEVVTLEISDCEISPRIQVVKAATAVVLKNHDPMLHMVHLDLLSGTNAPRRLVTLATPYAGFERKISIPTLKEPALLRMSGLNGHEWLTAYVAILPFQWTTLSEANGQFKLPGVRPGNYKIYVWHETLGTLAGEVKVASNRTANVNLEYTTVPPHATE